MNKVLKIIIIMLITISITACNEKKQEKPKSSNNGTEPKVEEKKEFYEYLPMPSSQVDKIVQNEKTSTKKEFVIYVNEYSYEQYYNYIMSLEAAGFHYGFVDVSVPKDISKLTDKTETSWAANKDGTWIRALWRSNDNKYYSGYNLQIIFNNYNYLIPIEPDEKKETKTKTE